MAPENYRHTRRSAHPMSFFLFSFNVSYILWLLKTDLLPAGVSQVPLSRHTEAQPPKARKLWLLLPASWTTKIEKIQTWLLILWPLDNRWKESLVFLVLRTNFFLTLKSKKRKVVKHTMKFLLRRKQSKKSLLSSGKSKVLTSHSFRFVTFNVKWKLVYA